MALEKHCQTKPNPRGSSLHPTPLQDAPAQQTELARSIIVLWKENRSSVVQYSKCRSASCGPRWPAPTLRPPVRLG